MSNQQDRPDLSARRRKPQPAADERVDPVNYRQPEPSTAAAPAATPVVPQIPVTNASAPRRGRPRREITVPFSTRLAPDVLDLIDAAVADGKADGTIRSVIEDAIRSRYQGK